MGNLQYIASHYYAPLQRSLRALMSPKFFNGQNQRVRARAKGRRLINTGKSAWSACPAGACALQAKAKEARAIGGQKMHYHETARQVLRRA